MKSPLRDDRLSRLQPTDDLRLAVDRDAFIHLALFKLSWRMPNENYVFPLNLLKRARGHGDRLFAEFGGKLDVGKHIRLEAQVMIGYFAADASRSCLRIEHVTDVSHFAFK